MRGAVEIEGASKAFGGVPAVRDVSFAVKPGEFVTLLGPSGCGKTTLLRLLAGFEEPDAGRIVISGQDMSGLPSYERPVNTVFQHYALFPHLSVARNVGFGLERAQTPRAEIPERVAKALEMVRLQGYGERRIDQLSGGQKQRVALARAMVLQPDVLLLDEPMAALDLKLRKEMQVEVKNLQERLKTTFVFVTHDQDEALIMSDRIAVMNEGRIEQVGTPEALYARPRTRVVADFLAVKNFLEARVSEVAGGLASLDAGAGLLLRARDDGGWRTGERTLVGIRPERIAIGDGAAPDGAAVLQGTIDDEIYLGDTTDWRVRVGAAVLTVSEGAATAQGRKRGDAVRLVLPPDALLRLEESPA